MSQHPPLMSLEDFGDDVLLRILRELSPEDLRNVFPVSKRLFACAVEAKGWTYLPFDRMPDHVWQRFWEEVWLSEAVQHQLQYKMDCWVESRCPAIMEGPWHKGDDLWEFSSIDRWNLYIINPQVDEYEERTGAYRGFADQLTQIHGPQGNDSDSESDDWHQEWYDSDEYKKIRMQFQPHVTPRHQLPTLPGRETLP